MISPATGKITEYDVPTAAAGLLGIAAGPDGSLWFTEQNADKSAKYRRLPARLPNTVFP